MYHICAVCFCLVWPLHHTIIVAIKSATDTLTTCIALYFYFTTDKHTKKIYAILDSNGIFLNYFQWNSLSQLSRAHFFSSSSSFLLLSSVKNWITSCYIWVHKHIILFQFLFNSTIFQTRNGHSIRRAQVVSFYSHSFPQSQMYFENSVLIVLCALWRLFSTFDFIMFFSFAKNCVIHTIWCSLVLLAGNKKKYFQPPNKTRINKKKMKSIIVI